MRKNKSHFPVAGNSSSTLKSVSGLKSFGAGSLKMRQLEQEQRQQQKPSRCITEVLKQVKKQQIKQKPVLLEGDFVAPQQNHNVQQNLNPLPVPPAASSILPSIATSSASAAVTKAVTTTSNSIETATVSGTPTAPSTTLLLKVSVSSQRRTSTEQAPPTSHHT